MTIGRTQASDRQPPADVCLRPLFFVHIPKTGGVSVARMVEQRIAVGRSMSRSPVMFKGDPNAYDFVAGHFGFGFAAHFRTRPIVLTFIRDPVERAISRWRFAFDDSFAHAPHPSDASQPKARALVLEFNRLVRNMSLLELLERESTLARLFFGNVHTAHLMGRDLIEDVPAPIGWFEHFGTPTTMAELAEAQRNLEKCDVIGLTDDFDRSMEWLARRLGWESFGPGLALNVSRGRPADAERTPRVVEILTEWSELDRALYAHAVRLVAERRDRCAPSARAPLPRPEAYRFDQPIHGVGWYDRELDDEGWFCWTGREEESCLYLRTPEVAADHRLAIRIAHVIEPDALKYMRLAVNGEALPLRIHVEGRAPVVETRVPAPILARSADRLCLAIRPGVRRRACDMNAASQDTRILAIALRQIDLVPV
jgi:hypothetical protein